MGKEVLTPEEVEKARAARRAYMQEYRKQEKVKERERAYRMEYWLKKAKESEERERAAGEREG